MKIQHLFYVFLLFLLVSVGTNASAHQFDINLTGINADYGSYSNIFQVQHKGHSDLFQDFGADNSFTAGDEFKEITYTQEITYINSPIGNTENFDALKDEGMAMYLYATNLSGYVSDVVDPGNVESAFTYEFYTGVGEEIGLYIGDRTITDFTPGDTKIASIDLLVGEGDGKDGFNAAGPVTGTTRLSGLLSPEYANMFTINGLDAYSLPSNMESIITFTSTNRIFDFNLSDSGFDAKVTNVGDIEMYLTPEPGTMILLGLGLIGIAGVSRKKLLKK